MMSRRVWVLLAMPIASACGGRVGVEETILSIPGGQSLFDAAGAAPDDAGAVTAFGAGGPDGSVDEIDATVVNASPDSGDREGQEDGILDAAVRDGTAAGDAADAEPTGTTDAEPTRTTDGEVGKEAGDATDDAEGGACAWSLRGGQNLTLAAGHSLGLAAADLNADGKLDLVVADQNAGTASIYLGNGDGSFQSSGSYPCGPSPWSVTIGDLNGDDRPDLIVPNNNYGDVATVSVLLGNGDGTFGAASSYGVGVDPESVAVGDMNGDGVPDLVVSNWLDATLGVLLGKGDGTFGPQAVFHVYLSAGPAALGDLNGDGKLDVAVASTRTTDGPSGVVDVLQGNGDGTLQPYVLWSAGFDPTSVVMGDLNADGQLDLAVSDEGSYAAEVLLGNGDGTFQAYTQWPAGTGPSSVVIGDFNGDGAPDLALANAEDTTLSVLLGYGDGSFATQVSVGTGSSPHMLVAGDLNGDGLSDLAVALAGSVEVFLSSCPR